MLTSVDSKRLLLGIDGGGTKCKAVIMTYDNKVLGTGISGPANPLHGFEQATNSIVESALLALKNAKLAHVQLSELIAGVGLAGVNLPSLNTQMSAWQHPFKQLFLTTDLTIACLGAHQGNNGAVIITGTGSCGFSCIDEQEIMIGGHGFPHGDKASGAWFGLQAVKQVLLALDDLIQPTHLTALLLNKLSCNNETELVEAIVGKTATYYASIASLVFDAAEQGDKIAIKIITEGADYIHNVYRSLMLKNPTPISLIGGLAFCLKPWLDETLQKQLSEPLTAPEVGAVLFAKSKLTAQNSKQSGL
ncbi:MAG: ATPase [Colwellia sp.]